MYKSNFLPILIFIGLITLLFVVTILTYVDIKEQADVRYDVSITSGSIWRTWHNVRLQYNTDRGIAFYTTGGQYVRIGGPYLMEEAKNE